MCVPSFFFVAFFFFCFTFGNEAFLSSICAFLFSIASSVNVVNQQTSANVGHGNDRNTRVGVRYVGHDGRAANAKTLGSMDARSNVDDSRGSIG